ncbi:hypothetical protein [Roseiflexus sp.]
MPRCPGGAASSANAGARSPADGGWCAQHRRETDGASRSGRRYGCRIVQPCARGLVALLNQAGDATTPVNPQHRASAIPRSTLPARTIAARSGGGSALTSISAVAIITQEGGAASVLLPTIG